MTSPYVEYLLREKAGIVLTASPTAKSVTSLPTASTTPAASYPRPAGNITGSTYLSLSHIDSARLMPIALTLMRTSCGPGAGTCVSMNSRTSGPPAFANLMMRDMVVSESGLMSISGCLGPALTADQRQLDLRSAAIGEQFDPRDEAGVIRAQKECDLGDLFGLRHAAHWDGGHDARDGFRRLQRRLRRNDRSRAKNV